jgi:hypothetical protein
LRCRFVYAKNRTFSKTGSGQNKLYEKFTQKGRNFSAGKGVLNHADFNIETHGVPPDVLCDICPFALTKTAAPDDLSAKLEWVNWYPTRNMSANGVPVGCAEGCLPTPTM